MAERPCDICGRPRWDGGHAQSMRECHDAGGNVCTLLQTVRRLTEALIVVRKTEEKWSAGEVNDAQRTAFIAEAVRGGLNQ